MGYKITLLESEEQPTELVGTKLLIAFFNYILRDYAVDGSIMDFLMKTKIMKSANMFGIRYSFESDEVCQYMAQFYRLNERLIDNKENNESLFKIPVLKKYAVFGHEESKSYVEDEYRYFINGYNEEDVRFAFEYGDLEIYDGEHIDRNEYDSETISTSIDRVETVKENIKIIKGLLIN